MKKRGSFLMLVLVLCMTAGCIATGEPDPLYMVDRTEGWEPSFPATASTSMGIFYSNESSFDDWRELLVARPVEPFGQVEETQVEEYAEQALRAVFGEAYLDTDRKEGLIEENTRSNAWIYRNGPVIVVLEKATGEVWACVDTRLQPQFQIVSEIVVIYSCQLEDLTREELLQFDAISHMSEYVSGYFQLDMTNVELPLDAQEAYALGEQTVIGGIRSLPAQFRYTGGAVYIYYCEASDAFFIVSSTCIQAIARDSGEQLLLTEYRNRFGRSLDESNRIQ